MKPERVKKNDRNSFHIRTHKTNSRKIVTKLTYDPAKHKQKVTRKARLLLQQKATPTTKTAPPPCTMKFGSFNVNGLDLEAAWAVGELLKKRGFDVILSLKNNIKIT